MPIDGGATWISYGKAFGSSNSWRTKLWSSIALCQSRSKYARKEQWKRGKASKVKRSKEDSSCSLLSHFWSTFRSPFFTFYIPFQSSGSQESNASNRVRFGAEMRKIWPSEDNCSRCANGVRNSHTPLAVRMVCETRTPHAWCEFSYVFADSTLDIFFCIFWCNFLSSPCNKPITSFAFVKTI